MRTPAEIQADIDQMKAHPSRSQSYIKRLAALNDELAKASSPPPPAPAPARAPTPASASNPPADTALPTDFGKGLDPNFDWAAVRSYVEFSQVVRERFPSWAWALDNPELGPILRRAASTEDWSPQVFESNLRQTQWWQARTAAQRTWDIATQNMGEADRAKALADSKTAVTREAGALGVTLSEGTLNELATQNARNGWTAQELVGNLAAMSPTGPGDITASQTAINSVASDYMVKLDATTTADLARRLVTGTLTNAGLTEYVRNIARQQFPDPQIAQQIDNGITLRNYFAPHRQILADALGRTPDSIDLTSAEFRPVMGIRSGDTIAPMTLGQVDQFSRTLDGYWTTSKGRAEKATMGRNLLQMMGVVA